MTKQMRYVKDKFFGTAAVSIDEDLVALSWAIGPEVPESIALPRTVFEALVSDYETLRRGSPVPA
jgi:hypothetical protein